MIRNILFVITIFNLFAESGIYCSGQTVSASSIFKNSEQDTTKNRQLLYNGIEWTNRYHRITGDQFLFSPVFMTGTVTINGRTFKNVRIKYDIFSDEIITPLNGEAIVQLNKEMVDSFTLSFENKVYRFTNIRNDTLKDFTGYINLLYKGSSSFYVKYKKSISPSSTPRSDGYFIQRNMMYLVKEELIHPIDGTRTLFRVLNTDKEQIRNFIRKNRLRISGKIPDSFVPVILFYDSLRN
jgi:hypothetical protein